jgi:glycosyltransferase involved in cell wall biosynthesis
MKALEEGKNLGHKKPRVSIGLPVFNGENYLEQALDSILAQTYTDFELIILDNASTDRTQQICREYAAKDSRIIYYCNKKNIGASNNFNHVFKLSSAEYFKWAAHDDVIAPDFLLNCIKILDADPSIVLCHSKTARIDESGSVVGNYDHRTLNNISSWQRHKRFRDLISIRNACWIVFGVFRANALAKTHLMGDYIGADRNLLAEIGLIGRICELPEHLFLRRDHAEAYTRKFCEKLYAVEWDNYDEQLTYWTPKAFYKLPQWKQFTEFIKSVNHVPMKWSDRLLCYKALCNWFVREEWLFLSGDLENALLANSAIGRKLLTAIDLVQKQMFKVK